jgi:hypothetical protein
MPTHSPQQYRTWAQQVILEMLANRHVVVWPEIEARAAEREHHPSPLPVDTNYLRAGFDELVAAGTVVEEARGPTRGGRKVEVIHLSDLTGIRTATARAAARKSLLYARYLSWASGSPAQPGIVGPAGERIVHESLRDAAPIVGYQLPSPELGQTKQIAGVTVPIGPLDNSAIWYDFTTSERFVLLIEVKNVRDWIWPAGDELPQLLAKAAYMTPDLIAQGYSPIPVLVCRRAHKTTFRMAQDLGFHVVDAHQQFLPEQPFATDLARRYLVDVRSELGFIDLAPHSGPYRRIVKQFAEVIPARAHAASDRWSTHGVQFYDTYDLLHVASTSIRRGRLLGPLRRHPDSTGGW